MVGLGAVCDQGTKQLSQPGPGHDGKPEDIHKTSSERTRARDTGRHADLVARGRQRLPSLAGRFQEGHQGQGFYVQPPPLRPPRPLAGRGKNTRLPAVVPARLPEERRLPHVGVDDRIGVHLERRLPAVCGDPRKLRSRLEHPGVCPSCLDCTRPFSLCPALRFPGHPANTCSTEPVPDSHLHQQPRHPGRLGVPVGAWM